MTFLDQEIAQALGEDTVPPVDVTYASDGALPSYWQASALATASVAAAGRALAGLTKASSIDVDARLASMWFDMTLRPEGWDLPGLWDAVAGDYPTRDGWVRLHTNAAHHREAALSVLGCDATRDVVAEAVSGWDKTALQDAVVAAGGCAAAMHTPAEWAAHPQGRAVARAPLVTWDSVGQVSPAGHGLQGIKVLDLTRILAGPVATRFLAGFGADVLRLDAPDWDEPTVAPEVTLGKRCAPLDLKDAEGRAQFLALLKDADVLVHGYRPGALDNLGLGADVRAACNPALIDVSLCAYGWHGPWAERRGFDSLVQMSCGIAAQGMAAADAARPVPLPMQALDHATGYLMAASVLHALRIRQTSGDVRCARLSLARTAALLMQAGAQAEGAGFAPEENTDIAPTPEATSWGPARRLTFPLKVAGQGPEWPHPAGRLKRHAAAWG